MTEQKNRNAKYQKKWKDDNKAKVKLVNAKTGVKTLSKRLSDPEFDKNILRKCC